MKKSAFLLCLACFLSISLTAQTEKGTGFIGLNFDNIFSIRQGKFTGGVFVANDFSIGINTNIGAGINSIGENVSGSDVNIGGSLFGRYHFLDTSKDFRPFLQAEVGLNRNRIDNNGVTNWGGSEFTGVGGGFSYFLNDQFSLEATTQIRLSNADDQFNINVGNWDLGFKFHFGGKK